MDAAGGNLDENNLHNINVTDNEKYQSFTI